MDVPDFLTRYYTPGDDPFQSLNELPLEQASVIKLRHCARNGIGGFYAEEDYLPQRREIEAWMHREWLRKGGRPVSSVPVYMVLGESPEGEYDIRLDIQKEAHEVRIPLADLDLATVSFTFPDSMYELQYDAQGNLLDGVRTNTPRVYAFEELPELIARRRVYDPYRHYIEAQVWDLPRLRALGRPR